MERVVNECAAHLVSDLSIDTSVDTRSLPGINRNKNFVTKVDKFIADHVCNICKNNLKIFKLINFIIFSFLSLHKQAASYSFHPSRLKFYTRQNKRWPWLLRRACVVWCSIGSNAKSMITVYR